MSWELTSVYPAGGVGVLTLLEVLTAKLLQGLNLQTPAICCKMVCMRQQGLS